MESKTIETVKQAFETIVARGGLWPFPAHDLVQIGEETLIMFADHESVDLVVRTPKVCGVECCGHDFTKIWEAKVSDLGPEGCFAAMVPVVEKFKEARS